MSGGTVICRPLVRSEKCDSVSTGREGVPATEEGTRGGSTRSELIRHSTAHRSLVLGRTNCYSALGFLKPRLNVPAVERTSQPQWPEALSWFLQTPPDSC